MSSAPAGSILSTPKAFGADTDALQLLLSGIIAGERRIQTRAVRIRPLW